MIVQRTAGDVRHWFVAFYRRTPTWWVRLIPGEFKHVAAFGFCHEAGAWVFHDAALDRTHVSVLPDSQESLATLARWTADAVVLKIDAAPRAAGTRFRLRPVYCCTSAVASLVGLRGALRPDALYRLLIRKHAERLPVVVQRSSPEA